MTLYFIVFIKKVKKCKPFKTKYAIIESIIFSPFPKKFKVLLSSTEINDFISLIILLLLSK